MSLEPPKLSKSEVASIVEIVEELLLAEQIIPAPLVHELAVGKRSAQLLTTELKEVGKRVIDRFAIPGCLEQVIVKSLYMWYGCLMMAKLWRAVDASGNIITNEHRQEVYAHIQQISTQNNWIGAGFNSARYFRPNDNKTLDWVTRDSEYWK